MTSLADVLTPVNRNDFLSRKVLYVPNHAHGDITHPDVERGVITMVSLNVANVFVRFGNQIQSKACYPSTLVLELP